MILNWSHYILLSDITKLSEYIIGIQLDKDPLAVEKKNIFYNLDAWSKRLLRIFTIKKCLFGACLGLIVKSSNKKVGV